MADPFVSLTVDLPAAQAELAASLLHELGALGLEIRDPEAPPLPGVRAPAAGEAIIVAYFSAQEAARQAAQALTAACEGARLRLEPVADQDWSTSWRAQIRSVAVGRLWVGPPWQLPEAPAEFTPIVIEPKMAFGTGDHPTTRLCLEAIDAYLAEHPGAAVLDVGTGTGVLAIAARKLGAGRVVGTDNDPTSVELAQENARVNGAEGIELSGRSLEEVQGRFELVVANILANTLVDLAPQLASKVGDRLLLAGVLAHQRQTVAQAYICQGLRARGVGQDGEWVRLELERARE
jgi:ribosomal protein L11 methyltransferase